MSEQVIRHRGVQRDENGKLTGTSTPDVTLSAIGVAPGSGGTSAGASGGSDRMERGRNGEDTQCVVYFQSPIPVVESGHIIGHTDLVNTDELTVRGKRYRITVNDWSVGRGGLEVLCTRGQG